MWSFLKAALITGFILNYMSNVKVVTCNDKTMENYKQTLQSSSTKHLSSSQLIA